MRLNEEKILTLLLILSGVILILGIGIQYSDSKIDEYKDNLQIEAIKINNNLLRLIMTDNHYYFALTKEIWADRILLAPLDPPPWVISNLSRDNLPYLIDQQEKYSSGEISKQDLFRETKETTGDELTMRIWEYDSRVNRFMALQQEGSPWEVVKKILITLQTLLVLLLIFGHYSLFKKIGSRTMKGKISN